MPSDENKRARVMQQLELSLKPILNEDWETAEIALAAQVVEESEGTRVAVSAARRSWQTTGTSKASMSHLQDQ